MQQQIYPVSQSDPPLPPGETLPTMYDLPSEDPQEPGLPDEYHNLQPQLLSRTFRCDRYPPQRVFTGTDMNLYYDVRHTQWHKRPDWFLVVGISRLYEDTDLRASYVVWQEGVNPFLVVELLSPGTANEDLGENAQSEADVEKGEISPADSQSNSLLESEAIESGNGQLVRQTPPRKWEVYEQILRVPYYLVFSRYTDRVRFFKLVGGHYQEQTLDQENPRIWIPELEVGLGLWQGEYEGITRQWLRWYDEQEQWIPTDTEQALERAEQAEAQLEQVVLNLLQSGMTVEQVAMVTGLAEEQVRNLA